MTAAYHPTAALERSQPIRDAKAVAGQGDLA